MVTFWYMGLTTNQLSHTVQGMLWIILKVTGHFFFLWLMMTANQLACMLFPSPRALSMHTYLSCVFFHRESKVLKPKCYYSVSRSSVLLFIPTSQIFSLSFSILLHGWKCFLNTIVCSYKPLHFSGFQIHRVFVPIWNTHWGLFHLWHLPVHAFGWLPVHSTRSSFRH